MPRRTNKHGSKRKVKVSTGNPYWSKRINRITFYLYIATAVTFDVLESQPYFKAYPTYKVRFAPRVTSLSCQRAVKYPPRISYGTIRTDRCSIESQLTVDVNGIQFDGSLAWRRVVYSVSRALNSDRYSQKSCPAPAFWLPRQPTIISGQHAAIAYVFQMKNRPEIAILAQQPMANVIFPNSVRLCIIRSNL